MELADTSAWTNKAKDPEVQRAFDALVAGSEIATCDAVKMELLWSARDHAEFVRRRENLDALARCPIGPQVWRRAIDVFEQLAARGPLHHRQVQLPDLLVAAAAEAAEIPLCHYDADFDLIAEVTGQPVRAIAPLGSL